MTITWADPPASHSSRKSTAREAVAVLKQNPGKWALVAASATRNESVSLFQSMKRHGAEAVTRQNSEGRIDVYARWPEPALVEVSA